MEQQDLDNLKQEYEAVLTKYFDKTEGHKFNNGEGYDEALSNFFEWMDESQLNWIVSMDTINKLKN